MAQKLLLPLLSGLVLASCLLAACGGDDAAKTPSGQCSPAGSSGSGGGSTSSTTTTTTTTTTSSTTSSTSSGGLDQPPEGTAGSDGNTFDHFNDPGSSGQKDPFELLKERAEEGPPEIRTRLHSCGRLSYSEVGTLLASRGVDLSKTASGNQLPTAGDLYKKGADALGVAHFDARDGEPYFHTTAGATKLYDIFVQAAPEIIANIQSAADCQYNGTGYPMFDPNDATQCVYESLSCLIGRPATDEDLILCHLMLQQAKPGDANDLTIKQRIVVATFLAGAHTCE